MSTRPWTTPVSCLFLLWLVLAVCLVGFWYFVPSFVPKSYIKEFIAFKFALIALFVAITTFQWGWWQSFAQAQLTDLYEPRWMAQWRLVSPRRGRATDERQRRDVARWLRWRRTTARWLTRGPFRDTRTALASLASATYLLLVSVLADLVAIFDGANRATHALSLGTFVAAAIVGVFLWTWHLCSLDRDFVGWERGFRRATKKRNHP